MLFYYFLQYRSVRASTLPCLPYPAIQLKHKILLLQFLSMGIDTNIFVDMEGPHSQGRDLFITQIANIVLAPVGIEQQLVQKGS